MREIFKSVREKLTSRYLENRSLKNNKNLISKIKLKNFLNQISVG